MNFSVDGLNDASVLALLECDTPIYKGLILYPVPFMGDDDAPVVELIKQKYKPRVPKESDTSLGFKPLDYHVIFNVTPYADIVASIFLQKACQTSNGLLMLACDSGVKNYMDKGINSALYHMTGAPDAIRDIFETIDPMKIAKFGTLFRTRL